jgi:hypothetical protein
MTNSAIATVMEPSMMNNHSFPGKIKSLQVFSRSWNPTHPSWSAHLILHAGDNARGD